MKTFDFISWSDEVQSLLNVAIDYNTWKLMKNINAF